MRTKNIKLFVMCMALLSWFSQVNASIKNSEDENPRPIVLKGSIIMPPRSIEPESYYLNGYVYIICDSSVTSISGTVTRLSDNTQWSNSSSSNTLQIAVPTDPATYRLTFTMSDGSSYYGDYTLTL